MLSETAADYARDVRFRGPMEGASHYGVAGCPGDGPYVQIWLDIEGDVIRRAAFKTPGCPSSTAAASAACRILTGRTVSQGLALTGEDLLVILGGLPEGKEDYAFRTVSALSAALCPARGKEDEVQ